MHDHEKSLRRFRSLPDCRVVTAERSEDLRPEDLSDAEIYAGWVSPEMVTPEGMDALLPEMDVVALSLPGTDSVVGMFDERRLRLMKQSAILLNVGRGPSCILLKKRPGNIMLPDRHSVIQPGNKALSYIHPGSGFRWG